MERCVFIAMEQTSLLFKGNFMRNHELINLYQSLDKLKLLEGVEFAYFMAKTKQKVRLEMENIDKAQEPSEDFKRFELKRIEMCKKHAQLDDKNNPIIKDNNFILKDKAEFDKEMEALRIEFKEIIESGEKQVNDYNEFLQKENAIDLGKISKSDIPINISGEQMDIIINLIKED